MKSILFCFVLIFCLSFVSSEQLLTPETILKFAYHPINAYSFNDSNLSSQCLFAAADMELNTTYDIAQANYAANCSATIVADAAKDITASASSVDIDVDCTTSTFPYQQYQTLCTDLGGKWCTVTFKVDAELSLTKGEFDFDIKMFQCLPKNCSKTDVNNMETDINNACDKATSPLFSDFDCSISISCGSSAVIIIIIIIVIIVVLVVIAVVVVMVMRKRRSEYTPIKTGEYH
jgi:hypothetical protein